MQISWRGANSDQIMDTGNVNVSTSVVTANAFVGTGAGGTVPYFYDTANTGQYKSSGYISIVFTSEANALNGPVRHGVYSISCYTSGYTNSGCCFSGEYLLVQINARPLPPGGSAPTTYATLYSGTLKVFDSGEGRYTSTVIPFDFQSTMTYYSSYYIYMQTNRVCYTAHTSGVRYNCPGAMVLVP